MTIALADRKQQGRCIYFQSFLVQKTFPFASVTSCIPVVNLCGQRIHNLHLEAALWLLANRNLLKNEEENDDDE